jgi:hypothetical protein
MKQHAGERRQAARDVLVVRPRHFAFNPQTAASNRFQSDAVQEPVQPLALAEHDALVAALRAAGIGVCVLEDADRPAKPDALFPNNWVSFHADGTVILYPLQAPSRRAERRTDVPELLAKQGFRVSRLIDLSPLEAQGRYLEGTGSLVLDHVQGVAYAALSSRTHSQALAEFSRRTGLDTFAFSTADEHDMALYHTNVMLSIGRRHAVVCAAAVPAPRERDALLSRLAASGRDVVEIDLVQMRAFAANVLELEGPGGGVVAMSTAARDALRPDQLDVLAQGATVVAVPVPVIERTGGGSVRCMLAEIFLPRDERRDPARLG